jgi:hypothetical protein
LEDRRLMAEDRWQTKDFNFEKTIYNPERAVFQGKLI